MIRYVVTGPPRSGTQWTSRVLTKAGLDCGHEALPWVGVPHWDVATLLGECSWAAVPHAEYLAKKGVVLINLTRHPILTANSIVAHGLLRSKGRRDFIARTHPQVFEHEHINDQALRLWLDWRVEGPEWRTPITPTDVVALGAAIGHPVGYGQATLACNEPPLDRRPVRTTHTNLGMPQFDAGLVIEAMARWDDE